MVCNDVVTAFDGLYAVAGLIGGEGIHLSGSRSDRKWDSFECEGYLGLSIDAPRLFDS